MWTGPNDAPLSTKQERMAKLQQQLKGRPMSDEHCALLPVGTRIRFLKTLECGPNEYSPGNLYARKGDEGVITGHGTWEGYWVKWEHWPYAAFGASRDEFEPIDTAATPAPA